MSPWDPKKYDAWYETPLGKTSDRIEKDLVYSMAGVKEGEAVLDAGCGTGIYSVDLALMGARVTGLDPSPEMIISAKKRAARAGTAITLVRADAINMPFVDGGFDVVLSICMLCFVRQGDRALLEMKRVLRPGGRITIALLNSRSPWAALRKIKGLFKETVYKSAEFSSPHETISSLEKAGFKEIRVSTCLFFLPVNSRAYLAFSGCQEAIGRRLVPDSGAFLVATATKP